MYQFYHEEVAEEELNYLIKKMIFDVLCDDLRMVQVAKDENMLLKIKQDVVRVLRPKTYGVNQLLSNVPQLKEIIKEILVMMKKRDRLPVLEYRNKVGTLKNNFDKSALKVTVESQIDKGIY